MYMVRVVAKWLMVTVKTKMAGEIRICVKLYSPRGRVGRVTDCGVRGLGFKSLGSIISSRTETSSKHEWSGMMETNALYRSMGENKSPSIRSSTWPLNSPGRLENNTETKKIKKMVKRIN